MADDFYLRYYVGHRGKFGHEYLEFELKNGTLTYANNSNYKTDLVTKADDIIARKVQVSALVVEELKKIIQDSEIMKEDDNNWPPSDRVGRQELEVVIGGDHVFFTCTKLGSVLQVQQSQDPEGLRIFYYLVQDLKCFIFSLISAHFKIQPIQR